MEADQYDVHLAEEAEHWWYRGNRELVRRLLQDSGLERISGRVLDAGCGPGSNLDWLSELGTCTGVDSSSRAVELASARGFDVSRAEIEALPFDSDAFELVACFDVLYHRQVKCVGSALRELARVTAPGGHLVFREPAFPILKGGHDEAVHGARRFRRGQHRRSLVESGWSPLTLSYCNVALFFPALVLRSLPSGGSGDDFGKSKLLGRGAGRLLARTIGAEARLLRRWSLPIGTSLVGIARRAS